MKRNAFLKYLNKRGCVLLREGGKHSWWANPLPNKRAAVPRHNEISDILILQICKELGVESPFKRR